MRYIVAGLFECAKGYWTRGIVAKVVAGILGFASAFFADALPQAGGAILLLEVFASWSLSRADTLKAAAEPILSRLDFEDSLGWSIPKHERDEAYADFGNFEALGRRVRGDEPYFSPGTIPLGAARLQSNVVESALYTRSLAIDARNVICIIIVTLVVAIIAVLISGTYRLFEHGSRISGDRVVEEFVVAVLLLLVGLDLVPLALRYGALASVAKHTRATLSRTDAIPTEAEVVTAVVEYQIGRAVAPLLPTFNFLKRRFPLASIWATKANEK